MNGEALPIFQPTRGIRQSDPLSPYLSIIIANALSTLLKKEMEIGNIKGIKLSPQCLALSH